VANELLTLADVLRRINEGLTDFMWQPATAANDRGAYGDYPLHKVAIWGDIAAARILLDSGADIDAIGEDGDTPLHRAAAANQSAMVEFLKARGANTQLKNRYGIPAWVPPQNA